MDINRYSPSYCVEKKHLVTLDDYTTEEIFEILYATKAMKAKFIAKEPTNILTGLTVALLFGEPSLRTYSALEIGTSQLGGTCMNLTYSKQDMLAGENIKDVVDVISRYGVGALITRGIGGRELNEYCAASEISIINSSNEDSVPMQTLCDLFTIWEKFKKLEGLKLAYVGKGGNTAVSLLMGAIKCGMKISVATPEQYRISQEQLDNALQFGNFVYTTYPVEAVRDADIVYTDGYQYHEQITDKEREILRPYQVNKGLMAYAKYNAAFMHPLPATRGLEVTADIIDVKHSMVLEQGENRLHTIKALLALLVKF